MVANTPRNGIGRAKDEKSNTFFSNIRKLKMCSHHFVLNFQNSQKQESLKSDRADYVIPYTTLIKYYDM